MNPPSSQSLLHVWQAVAQRRAVATAVVEAGSGLRWTFGELQAAGKAAADSAARGLAASAIGPDVVYPHGHGAEFIIEVLGAWESGKIVCPLDADAPAPAAAAWRGVHSTFPDSVLAKTTSGSTGPPRHILFTGEQLAADAHAIVTTMGLHPDMPTVGAISLAHSYGFSNLVLPLILHGIPLVLAASPLPESVRAALEIVGSGVMGGSQAALPGVPAMWRAWHAASVIDARRIAVALSAGAPLPLDLEYEVWSECGVKIHNFLGSTECGGIVYDRTPDPRPNATLAGTPLVGVTLATDSAGRLVVQSPAVGLGYWPLEPEDVTHQPGRFRTDDLAESRPDGWHLLGRAADVLNLAGRKLHPAEIESLLRAHPGIKECLVFGIPSPDPVRGEEIVATVAMHPEAETAWDTLPAWLGAQLPSWKRPRHWWRCPNLAATARGKLPRAVWRNRFLAARLAPHSPTATRNGSRRRSR